MFRFTFKLVDGKYTQYSVAAKNYNEAGLKARMWCEDAGVTFVSITKINK